MGVPGIVMGSGVHPDRISKSGLILGIGRLLANVMHGRCTRFTISVTYDKVCSVLWELSSYVLVVVEESGVGGRSRRLRG